MSALKCHVCHRYLRNANAPGSDQFAPSATLLATAIRDTGVIISSFTRFYRPENGNVKAVLVHRACYNRKVVKTEDSRGHIRHHINLAFAGGR